MNNYIESTTESLTNEYKRMIAEVVRRERLIELGLTEEEVTWFEVPTVLGKHTIISINIDGRFADIKEFDGRTDDAANVIINFTLSEAKEYAKLCKDFWTTFNTARKTLRARVNAYCKQRVAEYSYGWQNDIIGFLED